MPSLASIPDTPPMIGWEELPLDGVTFPQMPSDPPIPNSPPGPEDQSEYMIGTVAAAVIFVESDGSIDPETETWDSSRVDVVLSEIRTGLDWWESQMPNGRLEFTVYSYGTQNTSYEPINRAAGSDQHLWIDEILTNLGFAAPDWYMKVKALNNYLRSTYNMDWAYTIFMIDSLNDVDGSFIDGLSAYAYYWGGPFVVMTYDTDGWGVNNLDKVTAHETGHTFYATDEYKNPGEYSGYLNIREVDNSGCMMDTASWCLSSGTKGQIGWLDSDVDGIMDPEDTIPTSVLDPQTIDPTTDDTLTYTGYAEEVPMENQNPKYGQFGYEGYRMNAGNDVSINVITNVEYRVDGGPWYPAIATDGAFDEFQEFFEFTTNPIPDGDHLIEVRAQNTVGNWQKVYSSDTIRVDTTGPTTLSSLNGIEGLNGWHVSDVTVTLNAFDPAGVQTTEYRIDSGPWLTYVGSFQVTGEGLHVVEYYSVDNLDNVGSTEFVMMMIDTQTPESNESASGTPGANGWFISSVPITLTSSDSTSGVQKIMWRMDGGIWQRYDSFFEVTGEGLHVLEYYGVDNAGNVEAINSVPILIDITHPTTTDSPSGALGANGWYLSSVEITLRPFDLTSGVNHTMYSVDGGAWQTYTGSFAVGGDGAHTVEYYSVDEAGNIESTKSVQVSIDTTPPDSNGTPSGTIGENNWYVENVTFSLDATDSTSSVQYIQYRIDYGPWLIYNSPFLVSGEGSHIIEFYSLDNAGNVEGKKSIQLKIDSEYPVTQKTIYGTTVLNGWYTSDVSICLRGIDSTSGVQLMQYRIDGGTWQPYSCQISIGGDGIHTLEYYSVDNAGNTEGVVSLQIKVDSVAPDTTETVSGTVGMNGWYVSTLGFSLSATDATSGVELTLYRVDGGAWLNYSGSISITEDGVHRIDFRSFDVAGNVENTNSVYVSIDMTKPSLATLDVNDLDDEGVLASSIAIAEWTGSDATSGVDRYEVRLDDGTYVEIGSETTQAFPDLQDGPHLVTIRITDKAGNFAEDGIAFVIDTSPPLQSEPTEMFPWYIVILVTVIILIFALLLLSRRKKRDDEDIR
ncbi:MAG: Ig-like domain repeat protein [Methanobacteriota archaeon]|nr:MAG: Ig-like domain repeat protein [Euryarchaeota archaeon]